MKYRSPDIRAALRSLLLADPVVSGLVGERVHPQTSPQGSQWPSITYSVTHEVLQVQAGRAALDRYEIGLQCWSRERAGVSAYDEATALSEAVIDVLIGYRGRIGDVQIQGIVDVSKYDDGADEDTGIYSVSIEATVWAHRVS